MLYKYIPILWCMGYDIDPIWGTIKTFPYH